MELSDAIKEAYEFAPADITYFDTLTITHSSFLAPIMVVNSRKSLLTQQGTYLPVGFNLSLPETNAGVQGELKITINFLPSEAQTKIQNAALTRSPVKVKYRQYIREGSSAGPDAEIPVSMNIISIQQTTLGIESSARFPDMDTAVFPRDVMTVQDCPGAMT